MPHLIEHNLRAAVWPVGPTTVSMGRRPWGRPPRGRWLQALAAFSGALLSAASLMACSSAERGTGPVTASQAPPAAPAAAAPASAQPSPGAAADLSYHMRASFWEGVQARDGLIAGDLERAQRAADALATRDYASLLPPDWKHWVAQLQQHARELSMAPNLDSAAQELGRLALACGQCHEQHPPGPARPQPAAVPWQQGPDDLDARMLRHQAGVEQLWDGLVLPSEQAWRNGTVSLTRAALQPPREQGQPVPEAMARRIEAVRALAKQARAVRTYVERASVYGRLIAGCADCHEIARPATIP